VALFFYCAKRLFGGAGPRDTVHKEQNTRGGMEENLGKAAGKYRAEARKKGWRRLVYQLKHIKQIKRRVKTRDGIEPDRRTSGSFLCPLKNCLLARGRSTDVVVEKGSTKWREEEVERP